MPTNWDRSMNKTKFSALQSLHSNGADGVGGEIINNTVNR